MLPPEQQALLILTCQHFPQLEGIDCEVTPITNGGSDRRYYRLQWSGTDHPPMVLMVYTLARADNPKFVPATRHLASLGVHVPEILCFDEDRLCVWLQDLGGEDLHGLKSHPWSEQKPMYQKALEEAAKLHAVSEKQLSKSELEGLEPAFDTRLYDWEQQYFLDHYVRNHCGHAHPTTGTTALDRMFRELSQQLAALPRCLVHRDFQSQNVVLHQEEAWLVDYQGLRLGLAEYDLASLLYDPYMDLSRSQREELLHHYADFVARPFSKLRQIYLLCAAQRLMQALGAYGNLSRNQGKPQFVQHIPTAVERLAGVCEESPLLAPLGELLETLRS